MDLQALGGRPTEMSQPSRPAIGSNYQQPQLLSRVEPTYSGYARNARLQGNVQISFTIGTDGVPRSLARVSGNSALVDMALEAVRRWRYQPAILNGQPVEAQTTASFNFQLR
jgi:protein TonB